MSIFTFRVARVPYEIYIGLSLIVFATISPKQLPACDGVSPQAHSIVAHVAVEILPEPIRPSLKARMGTLSGAAMRYGDAPASGAEGPAADLPDARGSSATSADEPKHTHDHYIMLDALDSDDEQRAKSFERFPRDPDAARAMFQSRRIADGGQLPWAIERSHDGLIAAWKAGNEMEAVQAAGVLLHLATDACMPFNTLQDREGQARNLHWPLREGDAFSRTHGTVRLRVQVELIERVRSRFGHEVRVAPERMRLIADCRDAIFGELTATHRCLEDLLTRERTITQSLMISDGLAFESAVDRYYDRLADEIAPIMEARLEAAVLLGTGLIWSAWEQAGGPPLTSASDSESKARVLGVDGSAQSNETEFIGSRDGSVYHRPTCRHVQRIRPENLVRFPTIQGAEAAGRKPCKACGPPGK